MPRLPSAGKEVGGGVRDLGGIGGVGGVGDVDGIGVGGVGDVDCIGGVSGGAGVGVAS